ncbi:MAG: hypothetical protein FWC68_02350 [Oscillospiraceae bacterium]|nr:hypothetical protein [Oscillospiraceae bacterium]
MNENNKKVAFYTLGCKVNQYETNGMIEQFVKSGYNKVEFESEADIYVVNTCTVTNMSDRKSRQIIRRAKKLNENAVVVVTGCYAEVSKDEVEKIEGVDLVVLNDDKKNVVEIVERYMKDVGAYTYARLRSWARICALTKYFSRFWCDCADRENKGVD